MSDEQKNKVISYLTLKVGEEFFALHVDVVLNIIGIPRITKVPNAPPFVKGLINLRGITLPVIDSRIKFGLPAYDYTEKSCIVVLDIKLDGKTEFIGLLVDEVSEVLLINDLCIDSPPMMWKFFNNSAIRGIAKVEERMILIIDDKNLFAENEISQISNIKDYEVKTIN